MSKCHKCKYKTCLDCASFYVPMLSNNSFGCKRKDRGLSCYCDTCIHQERPKRKDNFKLYTLRR